MLTQVVEDSCQIQAAEAVKVDQIIHVRSANQKIAGDRTLAQAGKGVAYIT